MFSNLEPLSLLPLRLMFKDLLLGVELYSIYDEFLKLVFH